MIDKRIGQRFKQCREKLGLTQEEFAKKMGVTINYISTIERGMTFPRCEKLVQLLNALGVPGGCCVLRCLDEFAGLSDFSAFKKAGKSSGCIAAAHPAGR